jgi:hypothetical protein
MIDRGCESEVFPTLSLTVKVKVPPAVGVLAMTRVGRLSVRPVGNVPELTLQL